MAGILAPVGTESRDAAAADVASGCVAAALAGPAGADATTGLDSRTGIGTPTKVPVAPHPARRTAGVSAARFRSELVVFRGSVCMARKPPRGWLDDVPAQHGDKPLSDCAQKDLELEAAVVQKHRTAKPTP
jgi:hypothetical protein